MTTNEWQALVLELVEAWEEPDNGQPSDMDLHGNLIYHDELSSAMKRARRALNEAGT